MKAIIDFFSGLGDVISGVVDFVINLVADLVYVVMLLGQFVVEIPYYFSWLPDTCLLILITTFSLVVIYVVINRK